MTSAARKLLSDAMALPSRERARVAAALLASLDGERDSDAEAAWLAEIERRADRILTGDPTGSPWDQVRERLRARLAER